jgi:hypothetical protein
LTAQILHCLLGANANLATVERVLEVLTNRQPKIVEYGQWNWLRALDAEDLREFVRDIREAIIVGASEGSPRLLDQQLRAWWVTAQQADDPLFRAILQGGASEHDFVEVRRPRGGTRGDRAEGRPDREEEPSSYRPCWLVLRHADGEGLSS